MSNYCADESDPPEPGPSASDDVLREDVSDATELHRALERGREKSRMDGRSYAVSLRLTDNINLVEPLVLGGQHNSSAADGVRLRNNRTSFCWNRGSAICVRECERVTLWSDFGAELRSGSFDVEELDPKTNNTRIRKKNLRVFRARARSQLS